ncbi:hypothetical protein VTI28DRAFT_1730 [Corynascus sepedonium]
MASLAGHYARLATAERVCEEAGTQESQGAAGETARMWESQEYNTNAPQKDGCNPPSPNGQGWRTPGDGARGAAREEPGVADRPQKGEREKDGSAAAAAHEMAISPASRTPSPAFGFSGAGQFITHYSLTHFECLDKTRQGSQCDKQRQDKVRQIVCYPRSAPRFARTQAAGFHRLDWAHQHPRTPVDLKHSPDTLLSEGVSKHHALQRGAQSARV